MRLLSTAPNPIPAYAVYQSGLARLIRQPAAATVSLRVGHARVLTPHRGVIHCAHAASLPERGRQPWFIPSTTDFYVARILNPILAGSQKLAKQNLIVEGGRFSCLLLWETGNHRARWWMRHGRREILRG